MIIDYSSNKRYTFWNAREMPDPIGLPYEIQQELQQLFAVWNRTLGRNLERTRYYYGHNALKDLGIAIPPSLTDIETVVEWPQKAVDALAVRSRLNAFTGDQAVVNVLNDIAKSNDLFNVYGMTVVSELTHSCAAMTVTRGEDGAPVIRAHDATACAMLWDWDRHRIKCGITVASVDDHGRIDAYNLYRDDCIIVFYKSVAGQWLYQVFEQPKSRPFMVPLVYRPSLNRPFGTPRISRAVMSITDSAVRTALRSEISAEFFTSPQKYLLGAPDDMFEPVAYDDDEDEDGDEDLEEVEDSVHEPHRVMTKWEAYLGSIFAVTRDEEGNIPTFGQLAAASMEPHIAYMRSLAARFSGATNVPISELGIVQDNPSSAQAIYAAKESLIIEAETLNESNGYSLQNIAQMALAIADNKPLSALTPEEKDIGCYFMNPARPSLASQTDAMLKQASVFPSIVKTRVYWEELGYRDNQIDEIMALVEREMGSNALAGILASSNETPSVNPNSMKASEEYEAEKE